MRHLWIFLVLSLLLTSCSDSSGPSSSAQDPKDPDPPISNGCEKLNCPNGCCDGKCVDLDSDTNHCGRCSNKCDNYCLDRQCVSSCSGATTKICGGICVDYSHNANHCGMCDHPCGPNQVCSASQCVCDAGYNDCDGNAANGCESNVASCFCTAGDTQACNDNPPEMQRVGRCKDGIRVCEDGTWGTCENYGMPIAEIPGNNIDDDCDGMVDELLDEDGDGYPFGYAAGYDCCDNSGDCHVEDPSKVNPGAVEDPHNNIDDDCDGLIDEDDSTLCSTGNHVFGANKQLTGDDAVLLARAMDICNDAATDGYGLVSAELLLADGSPLPASVQSQVCGNESSGLKWISPSEQVAVMTDLGDGIVRPLKGTMAALSSGKAQGKENTGFKDCSGTEVLAPEVYLNAHNGLLPVSEACGVTPDSKMANDSIMLRLKLKAPENAKGFKFRFKFFSKEYPKFVCGSYNDFFLALTDAKNAEIPQDHNISFDVNHNPVSVNNAFFTECAEGACKKEKGCGKCKKDSDKIVTAYVNDAKSVGATEWLETAAPIAGGEEFTLDLIIFDAGDRGEKKNGWGHLMDSLVLLDSFEWAYDSTKVETIIY